MARPVDQRDLDQLVEDHLPDALRFATRLTGAESLAEDLIGEALVRVARGWSGYRAEAQFRTWFFRIVINVFRDQLASKQQPDAGLPEDMCDRQAFSPRLEAEASELRQRIAGAVSSLPPRQREVLVLTVYEGLGTAEVAQTLGITEANVYATLSLARARLRKDLAPYVGEK